MALDDESVLRIFMDGRTRISGAAWLVTRDAHAAEDIFQNVVVKALTREISFQTEGAAMSWAFISARREGIDWLRRRKKETRGISVEMMELLEAEWLAESPGVANERIDALRDCLETLPENSQKALRLRYYEGLSCEEVAERMRIGLMAVYKRLSRLHNGLRQCVEGKLGVG